MTDPTPTRDEAVTTAMVNAAFNEAKTRRMTGLPNDFRAVLEAALASAPAPASGGVHAVREALLGYVLKPGQYEMASAFARGQNRVAVDMLGVLDEASLSSAATPVSEAGGERKGYISSDNGQGMGLPERCTRYHCGGEIRYEPTVSYSENGDNICTKCGASYGSDA